MNRVPGWVERVCLCEGLGAGGRGVDGADGKEASVPHRGVSALYDGADVSWLFLAVSSPSAPFLIALPALTRSVARAAAQR